MEEKIMRIKKLGALILAGTLMRLILLFQIRIK